MTQAKLFVKSGDDWVPATDTMFGGGGGAGSSNTTEATQLLVKAAVQNLDADIGAPADEAASSDSGTFSLISLVKRGLVNWTTLLTRIPALSGGKVPVTDPTALPLPTGAATEATLQTTKPFTPTTSSALAVTTTSSAAQAVTAGTPVRFSNAGSSAVAVKFGTSGVVAVAASDIDILPGTAEVFTVPTGATHFAAIMASGTGTLKTLTGTGA